jgi:hypothetical protein
METDVKYFCPGSCDNVAQERPRNTGLREFGPNDIGDNTAGFDRCPNPNSSDVRAETGCKNFGGSSGGCVGEVLGEGQLPACYEWSSEEVGDWIASLGFPLYRDCFVTNFITGRRLINMNASTLTRIGIRDFEHIQTIAKKIREILHIEAIPWNRSISLPPREEFGMFLECKCETGKRTDQLTWEQFHEDWNQQLKFQPPLCNLALLLPRSA